MSGAGIEHRPRVHEFLIGRYGNRVGVRDRRLIGIVRLSDTSRFPIFGCIINTSPAGTLDGSLAGKPLTLRTRESDDRGQADPFFVHATGTFTFTGNPADADTVVVDDGDNSVTFEFDNNGAISANRVAVAIGADKAASASNLTQAINAYGVGSQVQLKIEAVLDVSGANPIVRLTHAFPGTGGNNSISDTSGGITSAGMSGGVEANEVTIRVEGADEADITVPGGGRGVFIIEPGTKRYLRFDTDAEDAQGQLILAAWGVDLEIQSRDAG